MKTFESIHEMPPKLLALRHRFWVLLGEKNQTHFSNTCKNYTWNGNPYQNWEKFCLDFEYATYILSKEGFNVPHLINITKAKIVKENYE